MGRNVAIGIQDYEVLIKKGYFKEYFDRVSAVMYERDATIAIQRLCSLCCIRGNGTWNREGKC